MVLFKQVIQGDIEMSLNCALFLLGLLAFSCTLLVLIYKIDKENKFLKRELKWKLHEKDREIRRLERLSTVDELSGLVSMNTYRERLELLREKLDRALRKGARMNIAVFFIDLNDLKKLNDRFGHEFADTVIAEVGRRMKASFRRTEDLLARRSGDEFIIAAELRGDTQTLARVTCERLKCIKNELTFPLVTPDGITIHISCAVGIALFLNRYERLLSVEEVLTTAEESMKKDKQLSKAQLVH